VAYDAQSLLDSSQADGYGKLSARDLLICTAYALSQQAGFANAQEAVTAAAASGLAALSDMDLQAITASILGGAS
jgi:hypothetical protein